MPSATGESRACSNCNTRATSGHYEASGRLRERSRRLGSVPFITPRVEAGPDLAGSEAEADDDVVDCRIATAAGSWLGFIVVAEGAFDRLRLRGRLPNARAAPLSASLRFASQQPEGGQQTSVAGELHPSEPQQRPAKVHVCPEGQEGPASPSLEHSWRQTAPCVP